MEGPRVLVVEDDPDVLHLLDRYLAALGCRVALADSGERGVQLALADPPDLVLVDVLLPGSDGRQFVRALREDPRTRRCRIVVTSVLDTDDLLEIACDAVAPKPFRGADVSRMVTVPDGRRA